MASGAVGAAETVDGGAVGDAAPGEVGRGAAFATCELLLSFFSPSSRVGWAGELRLVIESLSWADFGRRPTD
jgi:hypothetical protein